MNAKVWSVISIILLVIGLVAGYYIGLSSVPTQVTKPTEELTGTIPIGVVICSDSSWENDNALKPFVEQQVNDYIHNVLGKNFSIQLLLEDAREGPTTALSKVQSLYAQGVQVILGFRWSSCIKNVLDYINEHHIVVISEGSTSPKLSIPDDYAFRLVPDDTLQSSALVDLYQDLGVKAIVLLYRGDAWGDGLATAIKEKAPAAGVAIAGEVRFSPDATEFSGEVSQLNDYIEAAKAQYGPNVVVQTFTFNEMASILQQAGDYSTLMNTLWLGSDGYVLEDNEILYAPEQSIDTMHICTYAIPSNTTKWQWIHQKYYDLTGTSLGLYGGAFYDSVWVTVFSIIQAGKYDGAAIKKVLPYVANNYFGVTGWTQLNENGDKAAANYGLYMITRSSEGNATWIYVGTVDLGSGKVSWTQRPDLSQYGWSS